MSLTFPLCIPFVKGRLKTKVSWFKFYGHVDCNCQWSFCSWIYLSQFQVLFLSWGIQFFFFFQLFDFDIEVKPILEVLVGKTVEQALLEVMEEEELANLRSQQRAFEELRNAELVEQQRLEEQERRHREEKVMDCYI